MDRPASPNQQVVSDASSQNADEGCEFGCKYCPMVFSSKQALGGHQNAHKVQRAREKTAHEMRDNSQMGYYGGRAAYASPYLVPHNRSHDLVERIHMGYDASPRLPMAGNPYGMGWPVPGSNDIYSGWALPVPVNIPSQSPGQAARTVQNRGLNLSLSGNGEGGSGSRSTSRHVYPQPSSFAAPRNRPSGGGDDQQDEDDSGLDLSLKL